MRTLLAPTRGVLTAPAAGRVRLIPPRALAGELEVYAAGDTFAEVATASGSIRFAAPALGFVRRWLVAGGAAVEPGTPLVEFEECS